MRYLIDSDYVADYLVAKPHAIELLPTLAQEGIGISLITVGEIYEGIYYGRDPQKNRRGISPLHAHSPPSRTHLKNHTAVCTDQGSIKTERPDHW